MQVLGIDLGTTNTVAAMANHVLPISEGASSVLPSVVAFLPNGSTFVGSTARRRRVIDNENTIYSSKRIIGRRYDDSETEDFRERYRFKIVEGAKGEPRFVTRAGQYSPTDIGGMVLAEVLDRVRSIPGEFAVRITVPPTFTASQREATLEAAAKAGLRNVALLDEPTATAYAYLSMPLCARRGVVYDLGGGTFDCAVVDWSAEGPRVLAQSSDLFLGGDDIDERLASWVLEYVLEKHNWDLANYIEIYDRLVARCEELKVELSERDSAVLPLSQVDPECPAASEGVTVTRPVLDSLCQDLMLRTFITCDDVLRMAGLRATDIEAVFLAGGSTFLPVIRAGVETYFGRRGLLEFDPTEVVARGASLALDSAPS